MIWIEHVWFLSTYKLDLLTTSFFKWTGVNVTIWKKSIKWVQKVHSDSFFRTHAIHILHFIETELHYFEIENTTIWKVLKSLRFYCCCFCLIFTNAAFIWSKYSHKHYNCHMLIIIFVIFYIIFVILYLNIFYNFIYFCDGIISLWYLRNLSSHCYY